MLSVIDAVVDSLWSSVLVAWGCKMASFAISPSSCTFFCRKSLHSGQEVDSSRHLQWKEWKQPVRTDQDSFGVEILHPGKSHFLVLSGLILQWYPRGRMVVLAGMLEHMVGPKCHMTNNSLASAHRKRTLSRGLCSFFYHICEYFGTFNSKKLKLIVGKREPFWWCEERFKVRLFFLRLKNSFCFFA